MWHGSPQLSAEKAGHCTRHEMSLIVFQKIRPVYLCTYSQVYKCVEKQLEQYTAAVNNCVF